MLALTHSKMIDMPTLFMNTYPADARVKDGMRIKQQTRQAVVAELDTIITKRYMPGLVYFISSGTQTAIGQTAHLPTCLAELQYDNTEPLEVVAYIICQHAEELERDLHEMFAQWHAHGEWYNLTPQDIMWACDLS
jgi:hypothetical protein